MGLRLRCARCYSARRLEVLFLRATLAVLVIRLVGLGARALNIARHVQATIETGAVFSSPSWWPPLLLRRCADFSDNLFRERSLIPRSRA